MNIDDEARNSYSVNRGGSVFLLDPQIYIK